MAKEVDHALRRQDDRRRAVLMDVEPEPEPLSGVSGPSYCPPCGLCQNCRYDFDPEATVF